jgi:hypothetical protein
MSFPDDTFSLSPRKSFAETSDENFVALFSSPIQMPEGERLTIFLIYFESSLSVWSSNVVFSSEHVDFAFSQSPSFPLHKSIRGKYFKYGGNRNIYK